MEWESVKYLNTAMEEMNIQLVDEGYRHKYVPDAASLEECESIGKRVGKAIKQAPAETA